MNPQYNPFVTELTVISEKLKSISALKNSTESELAWYAHFDKEGTHANLNKLQRALRNTDDALEKLIPKLNSHEATVSRHARNARIGFNPLNWISAEWRADRRTASHMHEQALQQIAPFRSEYNSLLEKKKNYTREVQDLQKLMSRYQSFDVLEAKQKVHFLQLDHGALGQRFDVLSQRAKNAESILGPRWEQLQKEIQKEESLQSDHYEASHMEDQLSREKDRYKRKLIHDRCEEQFNTRNPQQVRERVERNLKGVRKTIEKLNEHLKIDTMRLTREVRMVVVDGSNLLNRSANKNKDQFIGLAALDALIPVLARQVEKVILFFDHGATRKLRMTEQALCNRFSGWTSEVIVTPENLPADDTILAAANKNPHAYVISGDRFNDYSALYPWIKDRVFAPVIADNTLHLQDMFLEVPLASDR